MARNMNSAGFKQTVLLTILFLFLSLVAVPSALAAPGKLFIDPSTASFSQGSSASFTIKASTGSTEAQAVQACIQLSDASLLQLTNINYSENPLKSTSPSAPTTDCVQGHIQLGRFDTTPAKGTFTVAVLTFKALKTGAVTIRFDESRSFIGSSTPTSSGSSLTITNVAAAAPSPSPASPEGSRSTPIITDDKTGTQAVSTDVTALLGATGSSIAGSKQTRNPDHNTLYVILGGMLTLTIASLILAKFAGIPGLPFSKTRNAKHTVDQP